MYVIYVPINLNHQKFSIPAFLYTEFNMSFTPNTSNKVNATILIARVQSECMNVRDSFNLTRNQTYVMLEWYDSYKCDINNLHNMSLIWIIQGQNNCTFTGQ